jgi:outer membrane biosynthesis protein TonB
MAKNEDGEFELILGNRQLLSVFFIVVVLLGVFFTMGYIVGRNSSPIASPEVVAAHRDTKPVVIDPPNPRESSKASAPQSSAPPTETAAQLPPKEDPKPVETAKVEPPKPEPVKSAPVKAEPVKPPPSKPEPVKAAPPKAQAAKSKAAPAPAPSAQPSGNLPVSGQVYLQLAATNQHEADVEVDVLRKKGFKAIALEIPEKRGTFRVLVGPLSDSNVNKTKTDLQTAGFPGDRSIRRTF